MLKRIKARLKNRSGFSLAELLITLLILLMATAIVTAGIPAAAGALRKVVDASNAQMLLSTTMTRLRDELSTAKVEKIEGTKITFTNSAGIHCEIFPGSKDGTSGILLSAKPETGSGIEYLLVSEKAAGGLAVSYTGASYNEENGIVTISGLEVTKGSNTLASVTTADGTSGDYLIRVLGLS